MGIAYRILKGLAFFFISRLINHIDKNKDGNLSDEEINEFIDEVRRLMTNLKRRL